jgi:hypothetical protein
MMNFLPMKKTLIMLLGFAVVFAAGLACFSPSVKQDPSSPLNTSTNSAAGSLPER